MDNSVLRVRCEVVDIWQVSENDAIDSDSMELLALVYLNLAKERHLLWTGPYATIS